MKTISFKKYAPLLLVTGLLLSGCGGDDKSQTTAAQVVKATSSSNDLKSTTPISSAKLATVLPETFAGAKKLETKEGWLYDDVSAASAKYGPGLPKGQRAASNWDGILAHVSIIDRAGKTGVNQTMAWNMTVNRLHRQGTAETKNNRTATPITIDGEKGYTDEDNGSGFKIQQVVILVKERYLLTVGAQNLTIDQLVEAIKSSGIIAKLKAL